MRIMFDTNVIISMALFPSERFRRLQEVVSQNHTLVLSSFVVEELEAVADKKFPDKKNAVDEFLSNTSFELVYTPHRMRGGLFEIRDMNDYPVLYTAVMENVDILISGDKGFRDVEIDRPQILTPTEFLAKYAV